MTLFWTLVTDDVICAATRVTLRWFYNVD